MNAANQIVGTFAVIYFENNRQRTWSGGMTYAQAKQCLNDDAGMIPGNRVPMIVRQRVADGGNGARCL